MTRQIVSRECQSYGKGRKGISNKSRMGKEVDLKLSVRHCLHSSLITREKFYRQNTTPNSGIGTSTCPRPSQIGDWTGLLGLQTSSSTSNESRISIPRCIHGRTVIRTTNMAGPGGGEGCNSKSNKGSQRGNGNNSLRGNGNNCANKQL